VSGARGPCPSLETMMRAPERGEARGECAPAIHAADAERRAILAFVDDLAALAADLWLAGELDGFTPDEDDDAAE
jgi:hypothetical protein